MIETTNNLLEFLSKVKFLPQENDEVAFLSEDEKVYAISQRKFIEITGMIYHKKSVVFNQKSVQHFKNVTSPYEMENLLLPTDGYKEDHLAIEQQ